MSDTQALSELLSGRFALASPPRPASVCELCRLYVSLSTSRFWGPLCGLWNKGLQVRLLVCGAFVCGSVCLAGPVCWACGTRGVRCQSNVCGCFCGDPNLDFSQAAPCAPATAHASQGDHSPSASMPLSNHCTGTPIAVLPLRSLNRTACRPYSSTTAYRLRSVSRSSP